MLVVDVWTHKQERLKELDWVWLQGRQKPNTLENEQKQQEQEKKAGESRKPNKSRESDTTAAGTGFTVKLQWERSWYDSAVM